MDGGTTPPQSDSGEISRVLVLNLLWQSKRCSRTAQDISVLTTPSLLSTPSLAKQAVLTHRPDISVLTTPSLLSMGLSEEKRVLPCPDNLQALASHCKRYVNRRSARC